jgi:hypothetical protein
MSVSTKGVVLIFILLANHRLSSCRGDSGLPTLDQAKALNGQEA